VATTNDLKNGMTLDIEGQLWTVVEFQHVKPGKGPAFVRTKLKQVMTGKVADKTFQLRSNQIKKNSMTSLNFQKKAKL
jgi:elongation factor P